MKKLLTLLTAFAMLPCIANAEDKYFGEELSNLKALLDECESRKISVPYEEVAYTTLERFAEYIVQDEAAGVDSAQLDYNKGYMQTLYTETCDKLDSYLRGEAVPLSVKKYNMSGLHDFQDNGRSIYSIGYGHGTMTRNDIPNLDEFGANNIQMETGPTKVFTDVPSFSISKPSDTSLTYSIANDSERGNFLKVKSTNYGDYIYFSQSVTVEPNTVYEFGLDALGILNSNYAKVNVTLKGKKDNPKSLTDLSGTEKTYKFTYETAEDETQVTFVLSVFNEVPMLWADNLYVRKSGGENILLNGNLDDTYSKKEIESLRRDIELAAENNIAVSLLLSPHYFPSDLADEVYASGSNGFIKFNVDMEETREIIERYLRIVCDELKDCKGISNIVLTNEPVYITTNWYDYYAPRFNEWIVKKYGNIEALNKAYGKKYSDFSEVKMPSAYIWNSPLFYDWLDFNEEVFTEWHVWVADIVREYFPDTPLSAKTMNLIPDGPDNHGSMMHGANPERFNVFSDWTGNDAHSYGDGNGTFEKGKFLKKMLWYDYLSAVTGKNLYNSEDHIIPNYHTEYNESYAKNVRADLWQGMIHHNRMSSVWHWTRSYNTESDACNAILHRPDCIYEVGRTALDVNRLSDKLDRIAGKKRKVALYYSEASRNYCEDHGSTLHTMYENLLTLGQSVGFVSEVSIDNIYDYDVVVFGASANTTKKAAGIIEDYAEKGGTVVLVGDGNLKYDEYNQAMNCTIENPVNTTADTFKDDMKDLLTKKGFMRVQIIDNSTGEIAENVEWQFDVDMTGVLVNVMSLEGNYDISVYLDGKKMTGLTDTLSGEEFTSSVGIEEFVPRLLQSRVQRTPEEVSIVSVSDGVVTWNNKDEAYSFAHIYRIGNDNTPELVCRTDRFSYASNGEDSIIIRAVDYYGNESLGVPVNISGRTPLTVEVSGNEAVVTNTTDRPVMGTLSINLMDSEGKLLQGVASSFMLSPGQTTSLCNPFIEKDGQYIDISFD